MSDAKFSPPLSRSSLRDDIAVWALVVVVGWLYFTDTIATPGQISSPNPNGLYGLLTEAWYHAQLHLNLEPDPRLATLANPYAGYQGIPRLHDASYLHNKYYLYFGPTPVVLLQLPWRGLTGSYLSDAVTTTVFCFLGFALAAQWLADLRRRCFPDVGIGWLLLFLAALGAGSPVFLISSSPTFYTVPISAAFFCSMLMLALATRSVMHASAAAAPWYVAGASLMGGLAVGARPVYALALAAVLLPCAWLLRSASAGEGPKLLRRLAWAAILPAGVVGALLALHNYARFGSPFEFGMRYAMTGADITAVAIMGAKYIPENCSIYFLRALDFTHYFPFYFNSTRPYGVALYLPLALLGFFLPAVHLLRPRLGGSAFLIGGSAVLLIAVVNFSVLSLFHWSETRYMVDFAPALLIAGSSCGLALLALTSNASKPLSWTVRAGIGVLAGWTLLVGFFIGLSIKAPRPLYAAIEHGSNAVAHRIARVAGVSYGPLDAKITFPTNPANAREPLLTTGGLNGTGDIVYVRYESPELIRVGFFHLGSGGPESRTFPVVPGRAYSLQIRLGSLLPPNQHPEWQGADERTIAHTRRLLSVVLDQHVLLQAPVDTYPSTPNRIAVGANALASDVSAPKFSGTITQIRRLPVEPTPPPAQRQTGAVRLRVYLPTVATIPPQPLLATGRNGAGDLISVEWLPGGNLRFGHDCWGSGQWLSDPVKTSSEGEHVIEVQMLPLQPGGANPKTPSENTGRLIIQFDGRRIADVVRPFNPAAPEEIFFGYNAIGASSAVPTFAGSVLEAEAIPPLDSDPAAAAKPD
jgi:hypothetical protein